MKRERWATSLIIGILFFFFSAPIGLLGGFIFKDEASILMSSLLFFVGPIFGFIMLIVGIVQLIARKGAK